MTDRETTLTCGHVIFTLIEKRGDARLMQAPREPLPYAVFDASGTCLARTADRVTATWIMDGLEGDADELSGNDLESLGDVL